MTSTAALTLKRLSCRTLLIAASSPEGASFVWNTTPNEPFPTILHWVYCISLVSPVRPSCTFSRIVSDSRVSSSQLQRLRYLVPPSLRLEKPDGRLVMLEVEMRRSRIEGKREGSAPVSVKPVNNGSSRVVCVCGEERARCVEQSDQRSTGISLCRQSRGCWALVTSSCKAAGGEDEEGAQAQSGLPSVCDRRSKFQWLKERLSFVGRDDVV